MHNGIKDHGQVRMQTVDLFVLAAQGLAGDTDACKYEAQKNQATSVLRSPEGYFLHVAVRATRAFATARYSLSTIDNCDKQLNTGFVLCALVFWSLER